MVHGLGKRYVKFRTGKFRPGIAFTICINQLHLAKNDREGPKPVSKKALKKWNSNFRLEYSVRKKQDYLFRPFVVSGNFLQNDPNVVFHLLSNRISRKRFVNGTQPKSPDRRLSKSLQALHRPRLTQRYKVYGGFVYRLPCC